ncbi:hypothetical protein V492_02781 [Pseudogymnoascus sp. VKM F-4246]|nr:hypothetical protein V492_02781 [Pseudogymnoascus sp. VKM F-4246]
MPAVYPVSPLNALIVRNATAAANTATDNALQVVCAWPVSGQYGIASRMLYYTLIMTCVFYRKVMWLNKACMAAVWLFPAVTALHAIIIASVRVNGAIDMDIYGSFQICLTGILSAPVTFKLSRMFYGRSPGRNTILLWTALLLGGLLSLLVEFMRAQVFPCKQDEFSNPISLDPSKFPYNTTCGLTCSIEKGPFSPLREGSGNNIYIIPAPNKLTFGTATLFAAAGCIQVILSLMSMLYGQLEINWQRSFDDWQENEDRRVDSTRMAMSRIQDQAKMYSRVLSLPFFMAALLAVIVIGERNLFSSQLRYQTEPIASIGQWAPCTGAMLSVLWAYCADGDSESEDKPANKPILPPNEISHRLDDHSIRAGEPSIGRSDNEDSLSTILRRPIQSPSPLRLLTTPAPSIALKRRLSAPH